MKFDKQLTKIEKKFFFGKTKNHDLFISPKRKKTVLEMSFKIIHYVQTLQPDVKNELFFQEKAIFSAKNAQFEKF